MPGHISLINTPPALPDCSISLGGPQFELSACFWWNVTTAIYPRAALENIWQRPLLKRDKCDTSETILKSAHKQNFVRIYFWAKSCVTARNFKVARSESQIIQDLSSENIWSQAKSIILRQLKNCEICGNFQTFQKLIRFNLLPISTISAKDIYSYITARIVFINILSGK